MSIPVGATHVVADIYSLRDEQKVMNNKYPYRKKDGDLWLAFVDDEWVNVWFPDPSRYQKINQPWSGPEDGLPPVGAVCEYSVGNSNCWYKCEIKYVLSGGNGVVATCHLYTLTDQYLSPDDEGYSTVKFRAIKKPDQQAADKRETAIRELMDIAQVDCRVTAARLVDAGFKRGLKTQDKDNAINDLASEISGYFNREDPETKHEKLAKYLFDQGFKREVV